jgi:hypothetical protein
LSGESTQSPLWVIHHLAKEIFTSKYSSLTKIELSLLVFTSPCRARIFFPSSTLSLSPLSFWRLNLVEFPRRDLNLNNWFESFKDWCTPPPPVPKPGGRFNGGFDLWGKFSLLAIRPKFLFLLFFSFHSRGFNEDINNFNNE